MKAKYYPNSTFLDAALGHTPSFSWRSMWGAKALLKEGMCCRIGNGRSVKVWEDAWLISEEGKTVTTPPPIGTRIEFVSDLIDAETATWNEEIISQTFNDMDRQLILGLPLSSRLPQDTLMWSLDSKGIFTVRTAYLLGASLDLDSFERYWVKLWQTPLLPKTKHFWWRVVSNILPTRAYLKYRHMIELNNCPRCQRETEDLWHAIFDCEHVKHGWTAMCSKALQLRNTTEDIGQLLEKWQSSLTDLELQQCCTLAWLLWVSRNELIFNGKQTMIQVLISRAKKIVEELNMAHLAEQSRERHGLSNSTNHWQPPDWWLTKLNVDAAILEGGWIGLGAVARDAQGNFLWAATKRIKAHWTAQVAEAKAVWFGLRSARRLQERRVIVESDCLSIIQRIQNFNSFLSEIDIVIDDIIFASHNFTVCKWNHVKRDGNSAAHNMAKVCPIGLEQVWVGVCPS